MGSGSTCSCRFWRLIGYRGYEGGGPSADSAATFLEPILKAWGIPYEIVENDAEVEKVVPKMYKQGARRHHAKSPC